MEAPEPSDIGDRTGWIGAVARIITFWAILGGFCVVAVVLMNVWSVISGVLAGWSVTSGLIQQPFAGDFELTQMGIAVGAFAFLPYCQLTGANVTADIFTAGASRRWVAIFTLVAAIVALAFAILLTWRTYEGLLSQYEYGYQTTIRQWRTWWAYVPAVGSLALLAVAALITVIESVTQATRPEA